jgi:hypothetical protein
MQEELTDCFTCSHFVVQLPRTHVVQVFAHIKRNETPQVMTENTTSNSYTFRKGRASNACNWGWITSVGGDRVISPTLKTNQKKIKHSEITWQGGIPSLLIRTSADAFYKMLHWINWIVLLSLEPLAGELT